MGGLADGSHGSGSPPVRRPVPEEDDLTRPYWEAARQHHLVMQRCRECSRLQHPPAPQCQNCRSEELAWSPVVATGRVHEYTVVRMGRIGGFEEGPYICVTVAMDEQEGLFSLGNLLEHPIPDPGESLVGLRVEATFQEIRDVYVLPQFRPANGVA